MDGFEKKPKGMGLIFPLCISAVCPIFLLGVVSALESVALRMKTTFQVEAYFTLSVIIPTFFAAVLLASVLFLATRKKYAVPLNLVSLIVSILTFASLYIGALPWSLWAALPAPQSYSLQIVAVAMYLFVFLFNLYRTYTEHHERSEGD